MMKKLFSLLLALVLLTGSLTLLAGCNTDETVLNVYNWGEYISDGEEGSYDTNAEFEKWYFETYGVKVRVNYDTYDSNESLRAKIQSGAVNWDIIIPSDYMIDYFIENDMLEKLDYSNIPNYSNISQEFRGLFYDPTDEYTVPYTYGVIGIIYDANEVSESDVTGWELMWNSKYSDEILQYNNSRDAFGTAMYKLGIDVNTTDRNQWDAAFSELAAQKPLIKSYVMDEVYNMMETGEAAICSYYAGDYFTMLDNQADNVDLRFYQPQVTNIFVDAMCIPKGCKNKALAEAYINFMLSEEPAVANAEYISYASPNSVVRNSAQYVEDMGEEAMAVLYPVTLDFTATYTQYAYRSLDSDTLNYLTRLWEDLKIS